MEVEVDDWMYYGLLVSGCEDVEVEDVRMRVFVMIVRIDLMQDCKRLLYNSRRGGCPGYR